jgi:hypothetical protein
MGPTWSTQMYFQLGNDDSVWHGVELSSTFSTHNLERISPFFEKIPNSMQLVINTSNAELHVQDINRFRSIIFDEGLLETFLHVLQRLSSCTIVNDQPLTGTVFNDSQWSSDV